jgi:hypothetical protein
MGEVEKKERMIIKRALHSLCKTRIDPFLNHPALKVQGFLLRLKVAVPAKSGWKFRA